MNHSMYFSGLHKCVNIIFQFLTVTAFKMMATYRPEDVASIEVPL